MIGIVIGVACAVVFVGLLVAVNVSLRRFDREVEVPFRELTPEQKQGQVVRGAAAGMMLGGPGC